MFQMIEPSGSYHKVQYDLRPAKQVERRMIIDALRKLTIEGFAIEDYTYVGFGSIYFVDFILFHKFLGIDDMLSIEYSREIEKRVKFNKPYDFIKIEIKPAGEVIPSLSPDLTYLLWLDFDDIINADLLEDVRLAATYLPIGSILLVTVDVEPPDNGDNPDHWKEYFEEQAEDYIGLSDAASFAKSNLSSTNAQILERVIKDGLTGRDAELLNLFNFVYADGHKMITIGGIIGSKTERRKIAGSKLNEEFYIRKDFSCDGYHIRVPKVTRKERLFLDSAMPSPTGWEPDNFELPEEDLQAYREIYKFFPAYAELLL